MGSFSASRSSFTRLDAMNHPTTPVDSMRFTTFESKFGRVTVRYSGKDTYEGVLTYHQSKYGPLDLTPG